MEEVEQEEEEQEEMEEGGGAGGGAGGGGDKEVVHFRTLLGGEEPSVMKRNLCGSPSFIQTNIKHQKPSHVNHRESCTEERGIRGMTNTSVVLDRIHLNPRSEWGSERFLVVTQVLDGSEV